VSAFTTTVITVFIGPYLTNITKAASVNGFVSVFGLPIFAGSFVPYTIALSVILQIFLLPYIGAISDTSEKKHFLFFLTSFTGAISTMILYFVDGNAYLFGGSLLLLSNLAFGASIVVYNSYLNDISDEDDRDNISSKGYAFGYLGGGLLLAINLALVMNAEKFGINLSQAVRISLCSAGVWWAIFSIIPIVKFKSIRIAGNKNNIKSKSTLSNLFKTIQDSSKYPNTLLFILAYIFYNDGVQAVIVVSSQFGQEALNLSIATLTSVILMVQFVAFGGAYIFASLANRIGTKKSLITSIIIWILAILYAYLFLNSELGFYILGAVIGLVLGGTQALSRSLFSLLIPKGKEAEYFGLYEISERGTSWIGPLLFGISLQFTASYKFAILSLALLFVVGFILLIRIDFPKAIQSVGNKLPKNLGGSN